MPTLLWQVRESLCGPRRGCLPRASGNGAECRRLANTFYDMRDSADDFAHAHAAGRTNALGLHRMLTATGNSRDSEQYLTYLPYLRQDLVVSTSLR